MGSLILCHKQRASQPYEIRRIHMQIYTIEELCYYLCNNLYLIDHTLMNRQLCGWIGKELGMQKLADELREELSKNCSEEQFVLTILNGSKIYSAAKIESVHRILEKLRDQKDVEKSKYKADMLMEGKEYAAAALVYQSILSKDRDDSVEKQFYGKVYACLGSAYGKMFLYEEAAEAFLSAYEICRDTDMLVSYLYCCYRSCPEAQYVKMLSGNAEYLRADALLKDLLQNAAQETEEPQEDRIEEWKNEHRKGDVRRRF